MLMVDVWVINLPREALKHASTQYNGMEKVPTFRVKMPVFTHRILASDPSETCSVASVREILFQICTMRTWTDRVSH